MHTILLAPSLEAAGALNEKLGQRWKLGSDGRPILGMSARALAETAWEINEQFMVIPAHAWTPWFAIFGSQSGFDSIGECFGDLADRIYAIETGFSSDPAMNWRVSALDDIALVSCSDAHSLNNLGREATIFEVSDRSALTYPLIVQMIKDGSPAKRRLTPHASPLTNRLWGTLEFFPEEGKYHSDGHRACGVRLHPDERKKLGGICPSCGRPVTVGVYSRVIDLGDRPEGFVPQGAPQVEYVVPFHELVAATQGVGKLSKRTAKLVDVLRAELGSEFQLLRQTPLADIARVGSSELAELVRLVREQQISMEPGYDGVYGKLQIPSLTSASDQASLFTH